MKKVTYIISDIDKALAFEWVANYLDRSKFSLNFLLLNPGPSHLESFLKEQRIMVKTIALYRGWKLVFTFFQVVWHLMKNRPDVLHTHLRFASLLGITAGWLLRIPHRIHTRHHSTFNHTYYPHAVKQDRLVNRWSTKIIAISPVVKSVLVEMEQVSKEKVFLVPHGFDLEYIQNVDPKQIQLLKKKYNSNNRAPVIGMISRYIHWKGIKYGIEAFSKLLQTYPNALLILANAKGPDAKDVKKLLETLPPSSYREIEFENNLPALYQMFDVFVHVPIDPACEAFGQIYVEALAAGIPSVFTLSGIAPEFIKQEKNALVVDYKNSEAIFIAVNRLLSDTALRKSLIKNGKDSVKSFSIKEHIHQLESLYE